MKETALKPIKILFFLPKNSYKTGLSKAIYEKFELAHASGSTVPEVFLYTHDSPPRIVDIVKAGGYDNKHFKAIIVLPGMIEKEWPIGKEIDKVKRKGYIILDDVEWSARKDETSYKRHMRAFKYGIMYNDCNSNAIDRIMKFIGAKPL